jgi:hypothetical protein
MSVIFSKGVSDPSDLTSRERMQFTWTMYELFGAFEFMFFVSKANAIPEEIWQRWSSAENNPTDTESTRRYQQFLAEGRVPT